MTRLARKASLLTALYLLTSAAAVHADSAWVLWEHVRGVVDGRITVGMHRQGSDMQLTRYGEKGWRATGRGPHDSAHRSPPQTVILILWPFRSP